MNPWLLTYLIGVPLTAAALIAVGDLTRRPGIPAPQRPAMVALVGGLLWPVVAIGAVQAGVWVLLRRRCVAAESGDRASDELQPQGRFAA